SEAPLAMVRLISSIWSRVSACWVAGAASCGVVGAVASSGLERPVEVGIFFSSRRDGLGLWLGCIHEGRGGPDGEHGDRRPATAGAVVALAAFGDGFVPAADENLVTALAVAGGA